MRNHTIQNNNVKISCFDSVEDYGTIPLLIIPGMVNNAEEYIEYFDDIIRECRCIFITLRGRKGSDIPDEGYSFYNHISDIDAIIRYFSLPDFHIYGHSVGAAYALGYALHYGMKGRIIIGDYPAYYPKFTEAWVQRISSMQNPPIKAETAKKIAEQSERINMFERLHELLLSPVLLHSEMSDSLIKPEHISLYKQYRPDIPCYPIKESGHALIRPSNKEFTDIVHSVLSDL